jgi:5-methylcytosine-specific restriction endonuclease McrBC GTP-binding regulatory subunit McrB
MSAEDRFTLWKEFIDRWPIEKLQSLTLEEYSSLGSKDSFCYWLESRTEKLGSIWGGSSYKFGVFEFNQNRKNGQQEFAAGKDDKHAWGKKYGNSAEEAFQTIKSRILSIAESACAGKLSDIDSIDLGHATKWKLAFLYQPKENLQLVPIYKEDWLREATKCYDSSIPSSKLFVQIMQNMPQGSNVFDYADEIGKRIAQIPKRCWIIAPGENAYRWDDFTKHNLIGIGWDDVGDMSSFENKAAVAKTLTSTYEKYSDANQDKKNPQRVAGMLWKFYKEISVGDIVFARQGLNQIIGCGIVKSDYKFDPSRDEYQHVRDVEWTHIGQWNCPVTMAQATLVSVKPGKREALEKLVNEEVINNILEEDMKKYVDLLLSNKQIIFTGAPGTGKTFLARQLAYALTGDDKENHPHVGFCQFHPSFDYTDFVEGLRPTKPDENGNIGFERQDGIFKSFCKKAAVVRATTFQDLYERFLQKIQAGDLDELKQRGGAPISIKEISGNNNIILQTVNGESEDQTYTVSFRRLQKLASTFPNEEALDKIKNIDKEVRAIIGGCHSSGYWAALKAIWHLKLNISKDSPDQKYVFIIDEINRGDISKIFGELFFAIDPGYRGKSGRVKTQYTNLLEEGDLFKEGFYVPENVYIIGTMNDIDRSVESMDFAIRRRFSWVEIKAQEAISMWEDEIPEYREQAKAYMTRLNAAISKIDSLGDAFHIGPAYFLKLKDYGGDKQGFQKLWDLHLAPLLREYLRGTPHIDTALKQLNNTYFQEQESLEE